MLFRKPSGFRFSHAMRRWGLWAGCLLVAASPAHAETLKEALAAAYLYNPTLKAAQAQLRSTDNGVSIAKSGYRPTVSATVQDGWDNLRTKYMGLGAAAGAGQFNSLATGVSYPFTAQITATETLFDGFRTYNNIKGAEALVDAGRENLRNQEISVLLNAVTYYMNTFRDAAIVKLRQNNVKVLTEQLRATEDRFKVGEVTRTDVAQAQSGLASAQADLSIAQGTLYGDEAFFAQYIGHPPVNLKDPGPPTRRLPKTLQEAIEIADAENPGTLAAIFNERAQQHQVKAVKAQLLPSLSVNASQTWANEPFGAPKIAYTDESRVYGQLTVPLYEAGSVSAQIRQAIETLSQMRQNVDAQRELARANVSSQWGLIVAAKGNVAAGKSAVEATRIALQGVREEEKVGQRTILDVLNSEQQFLNAGVNLVSFQHDLVVACYGVIAYTGRLTASDIALEVEVYDPTRYYGEVKDAWYGWGAAIEDRQDPRVAPVDDPGRTVGQRATDGPAYTQNLPQIP